MLCSTSGTTTTQAYSTTMERGVTSNIITVRDVRSDISINCISQSSHGWSCGTTSGLFSLIIVVRSSGFRNACKDLQG